MHHTSKSNLLKKVAISQTKSGTNCLAKHVPRYVFGYACVYHHLLDVSAVINLDYYDVAVRAVDDATGLKSPTVVCHALDCRLVLAGEGYARKTVAIVERLTPDARHARRDRHRRQTAATLKRLIPDARHA